MHAHKKKTNGAKARGGLIAALDVGTSKVCCLIARPGGASSPTRIVGLGHLASRGLRAGVIVYL